MRRQINIAALFAATLAVSLPAAEPGGLHISDRSYPSRTDKRWKQKNGISCRVADAANGVIEVSLNDMPEALVLYHWRKDVRDKVEPVLLIRQFTWRHAPPMVTVRLFDDPSATSPENGYERVVKPLVREAGRYEIVSLYMIEEEGGESFDGAIGSCKLIVEQDR